MPAAAAADRPRPAAAPGVGQQETGACHGQRRHRGSSGAAPSGRLKSSQVPRALRRVAPGPSRARAAICPATTIRRGRVSAISRYRNGRQIASSAALGARSPGGRQGISGREQQPGPVQADAGQHPVEIGAGGAGERGAQAVVLIARRLADQQQAGVGGAVGEHQVGGGGAQRAEVEAGDGVPQRGQRVGRRGRARGLLGGLATAAAAPASAAPEGGGLWAAGPSGAGCMGAAAGVGGPPRPAAGPRGGPPARPPGPRRHPIRAAPSVQPARPCALSCPLSCPPGRSASAGGPPEAKRGNQSCARRRLCATAGLA